MEDDLIPLVRQGETGTNGEKSWMEAVVPIQCTNEQKTSYSSVINNTKDRG
jgi:hypothetical protein